MTDNAALQRALLRKMDLPPGHPTDDELALITPHPGARAPAPRGIKFPNSDRQDRISRKTNSRARTELGSRSRDHPRMMKG